MKLTIPSGKYCENFVGKYRCCRFLDFEILGCTMFNVQLKMEEVEEDLIIKCDRCKAKEKIEVEYE